MFWYPIDFSQASLNAFETAISIATANNAQLQILHVKDSLSGVEESISPDKTKGIIDEVFGALAGGDQILLHATDEIKEGSSIQ